jgi:hypothetical protein
MFSGAKISRAATLLLCCANDMHLDGIDVRVLTLRHLKIQRRSCQMYTASAGREA